MDVTDGLAYNTLLYSYHIVYRMNWDTLTEKRVCNSRLNLFIVLNALSMN